jgi:DNA-binding NarL/FixJ family response regulator
MRKLRILLAEDHATVRDGLKLIIDAQSDMTVVGEAADGRAAVAQTQLMTPDVVVMDVSMPGLNGLKATEMLHHECPAVKVVALTRHSEAGYLRELLRVGAAGYVLKQSSSASLLSAIRAAAGGGTYIDPAVARKIVGDSGGPTLNRPVGQAVGGLTPREGEVARLVAVGYANKDIAERLHISVKTVETHKANAMAKLGLDSRMDLVRFAQLQGWLDKEV